MFAFNYLFLSLNFLLFAFNFLLFAIDISNFYGINYVGLKKNK